MTEVRFLPMPVKERGFVHRQAQLGAKEDNFYCIKCTLFSIITILFLVYKKINSHSSITLSGAGQMQSKKKNQK